MPTPIPATTIYYDQSHKRLEPPLEVSSSHSFGYCTGRLSELISSHDRINVAQNLITQCFEDFQKNFCQGVDKPRWMIYI